MQTTYTYAVIAASGATVNVRANRLQAFAELAARAREHHEALHAIALRRLGA